MVHPTTTELPVLALAGETLVYDRARERPVLRLRGVVVLPVGATVELLDPTLLATVVGVRLLAGQPVQVCLDVAVPAASWGEGEAQEAAPGPAAATDPPAAADLDLDRRADAPLGTPLA